jgi:parallel beta-helix repeat protein
MNRAVFASLTILFLLSVSSIARLIQVVNADGGTITINADGSISPSTAPIYTADNITYTLTGNITVSNVDGLDIERDNIVLDGAGYTMSESVGGNGTTLTNRSNVTVRNTKIENFTDGICLVGSSNNTLSGNYVTNNLNSIVLLSSSDSNTLSGNNVTANSYIGIWLSFSSDNILSGNNVTANEFGIYLSSSSNNTLLGNHAAVNNYGIDLSSSSNNTLSGNNAANNDDGIQLSSSSNNVLSGNNVAHNGDGFVLGSSSDNILSGNNVTSSNEDGILLSSSSNNVLSGNNVTANSNYGIWLYSSSNCTLSGNNVAYNGDGIVLGGSSNNNIYHNNFADNAVQVNTDGLANIWDNVSVGNYWSDYLTKYPNATQVDSSGVWNTPYVIDANNTNYYPLMVPYAVIPEFPSFLILPLMMMATLLAVIIYKKKGVKTSQS